MEHYSTIYDGGHFIQICEGIDLKPEGLKVLVDWSAELIAIIDTNNKLELNKKSSFEDVNHTIVNYLIDCCARGYYSQKDFIVYDYEKSEYFENKLNESEAYYPTECFEEDVKTIKYLKEFTTFLVTNERSGLHLIEFVDDYNTRYDFTDDSKYGYLIISKKKHPSAPLEISRFKDLKDALDSMICSNNPTHFVYSYEYRFACIINSDINEEVDILREALDIGWDIPEFRKLFKFRNIDSFHQMFEFL